MPFPQYLQVVHQTPQLSFLRGGQLYSKRCEIVVQVRPSLHARNGQYICSLRQNPGDGQLRQRAPLALRNGGDRSQAHRRGAGPHKSDRQDHEPGKTKLGGGQPDGVEPLHKISVCTGGGSPEDFQRYIQAEVKKATEVAIAANIRQ